MFSDSEAEDEVPSAKGTSSEGPPADKEDGKRREATAKVDDLPAAKRARSSPADESRKTVPGARSKASTSTTLDRIKKSYADPRLARHTEAPAEPRVAKSTAVDHWTSRSVAEARRRGAELRANPSGLDGRAAYERESMHGKPMVLSVGPSSLPSACRVTKSRIPSATASWS
mmetsp:Transcript_10599/g.26946  ORF Transcript_10599/g.26946 Transcript_10599/m.26946 type:complete len:172 (+) Transcript_10599:56-571(+)|eukprot:CAMPEP_0197423326 /NCGR_PEP_ID=MMETSP1170-20131217/20854_1 /TAXON_ID=54406 /ORGANISM="Sarcinochrysis sp, Strain CCMP770" /LENGTH=171 /DNA_ID=CAMNT_0042950737 /DNA_START=56 /DNA_END=571 /DNA_ORIENTATION=+